MQPIYFFQNIFFFLLTRDLESDLISCQSVFVEVIKYNIPITCAPGASDIDHFHTRSLRDDRSKRALSQTMEVQSPEVVTPEVTSSPRRQQVVIVTSGRTGSTFTASIITAHPQVRGHHFFYKNINLKQIIIHTFLFLIHGQI